MSDPPARRHGYLGLIIPFGLVALALAAWTVWWFVSAGKVEAAVDREAAGLRRSGWQVQWSARVVRGWPFRTFVGFNGFKAVAPSGRGLEAPRLEAEAESYDLGKWVIAAPQGVILKRGEKGAVRITGQAVRASISHFDARPPQLAVELRSPTFEAVAGSEPFALASADRVELYLRPKAGASDQAEFLMRVLDGRARPGGELRRTVGENDFTLEVGGAITRFDRLSGRDWSQAVRDWTKAGGAVVGVRADLQADGVTAKGESARLGVATDGRLVGDVAVDLGESSKPISELGRTDALLPAAAAVAAALRGPDGKSRLQLVFAPDGLRLGPVKLAPPPRVF
jgi:hypothetical protein